METSSTGGSHGISFDFPWYSLNLFARLYTFFSLQKSKESQATHAPSKPKRSVSILLGITTKVFKSPMSGGVSNVWLDTLHDHSTIQHAFNCIYCIYCIDCSFYIPTYFLYIYIYYMYAYVIYSSHWVPLRQWFSGWWMLRWTAFGLFWDIPKTYPLQQS